jgi:DNA-binding SARP family transcriptional activator
MAMRLITLGGLRAFVGDRELDWLPSQRLRAALFVYLAVERRAPREGLLALFWPESDAENGRHALRQSLYQLRKALGHGWLESRAHELRIGDGVWTDVGAFDAALERQDPEAAAELYHGPFLDGVHLVDLAEWEGWVDGRRAQYAREFRKACRAVVEARRAGGDLAGAVEAAQRWVAPDPLDDEAQHRLIEALADAGERAEAIRQYETYERLLEPDGLRPLDETEALVHRVRSAASGWPEPWRVETAAPPSDLPLGEGDGPGGASAAAPDRGAAMAGPARRILRSGFFRTGTLVAGVGAMALGSAWLVPRMSSAPLDAERVVVFPLAATDPGLRGSGAGWDVALAIGAAFEHAEPLRWIDGWSWLPPAQRDDPSRLTPDLAREITRARGARYYVEGAIRGPPERRAVVLRLYDVVGDSLVTQRQQTASDPEGGDVGLSGLGLRAVLGVLQPLLAPGVRVDLAPIADRAPAAIALWIRGEHEYRSARFESALDYFRRALEQDSLLVFAAVKGALAAGWMHRDPGYSGLLATAVRHDSLLPPKHRLLSQGLQRMGRGEALPAIGSFGDALAIDPDWADGWMALGEAHYHLLPGTIRSPGAGGSERAMEAFSRAASVDSGFSPPLVHLAEHAARTGRVDELEILVHRLELRDGAPSTAGWVPLLLECYRGGTDAFARPGRDVQHVGEASRTLAAPAARPDCAEGGFRWVLETADDRSGEEWGAMLGLTSLLLSQGRYAELDRLLERRLAAGLPGVHAVRLYSTLAGAPFAAQATEAADAYRTAFGEEYTGAPAEARWLLGIWHARMGDPDRTLLLAEGLEREGEETGDRSLHTWADALRAHAALAEGDTPRSEALLSGLSSMGPSWTLAWSMGLPLPFERMALARVLLEQGRFTEAYEVAAVFDHPYPNAFVALVPESLAIRARAAEGLGRSRVAREHRSRLEALGWTGDGWPHAVWPDGGTPPLVDEP